MTDEPAPTGSLAIYAAFQGGGAKAVAYAGAVAALEDAGYSFKGVAGTSAGSIVAALLAARFDSGGLERLVPELLRRVGRPPPSATWLVPSVGEYEHSDIVHLGRYSLEAVRAELEKQLRIRIRGTDDGGDVTFEELHSFSGIELNVLFARSPGVPAVLNHHNSPDCQVSYAVAASSAIPFLVTPQLLVLDDSAERLIAIDGGVWANFPDLCFRDPSLRYYEGADELAASEIVAGFVLDPTDEPLDGAPLTRKSSMARVRRRFARRAQSSPLGMLGFAAALSFIAITFILFWMWTVGPMDVGFVVLRVAFTILFIPALLVLALLLWLSRWERVVELTLPTFVGGLTSVTTGVPEWAGAHPSRRVITVPASDAVVETMTFDLPQNAIDYLIARARTVVGRQLAEHPLERPHPGRRQSRTATRFLRLDKFVYKELSGIGKALAEHGVK